MKKQHNAANRTDPEEPCLNNAAIRIPEPVSKAAVKDIIIIANAIVIMLNGRMPK